MSEPVAGDPGALRRAIAAFFAWPPPLVAVLMVAILCVCYLVLPPWLGVPLVLLLAGLPWYEEHLP